MLWHLNVHSSEVALFWMSKGHLLPQLIFFQFLNTESLTAKGHIFCSGRNSTKYYKLTILGAGEEKPGGVIIGLGMPGGGRPIMEL